MTWAWIRDLRSGIKSILLFSMKPAVRAAAGSVADWFSGNDEVVVVVAVGLTGCWAGWRRSEVLDRPRPQPSDPWHYTAPNTLVTLLKIITLNLEVKYFHIK